MQDRKNEISIINALLCLIVVLIHIVSAPLSRLTIDAPIYKYFLAFHRLSAFVVQAFIFISGMKAFLANKTYKSDKFILKKIKIIYIPYIIAVIIYYLFFVYILDYFPFSFKELFGYMLRGNVAAQFYFVIVIMQFFILYPVWKYISNKNPVIVMTISVILTVVLGLYMIFIIDKLFNGYYFDSIDSLFTTYLMYWAGGIFAGKYYKKFIGFVNKRAVIISVVFAVCAIADAITFYMYKIYILPPRHLNVIHAAYCISAILFCMMLCYKMRNKRIKFIDIIDRASYYIYLYHVLFIFIIDYLLQQLHIEIPSTTGMFALRFLITYSVIFIFAKIYCYVIKLLKRNS